MTKRKTVMVVCAHFHGDRSIKRDLDFMQPSAGLQVASLIDRSQFDVSLYHEMWHGSLAPEDIPAVDIVFLTGLQKDFDRMRQLAYFFRRQGAVTVAGGSICTLFPDFAARFFDVVCSGGVDSVRSVIEDYMASTLKRIYRSPQSRMTNYRVDYTLWTESGINTPVHLVEASRGCNFSCDFCVIPAEGATHARFGTARVGQMIADAISSSPRFSFRRRYPLVWFIDNNFSNHLPYLREVCALMRSNRHVKGWGALVTQNVLRNRRIMSLMASSKCKLVFSGLESLDLEFLKSHTKHQNTKHLESILEDIAFVQRKGINFAYGYLFDPRLSTTLDMREQLNTIVDSGVLPYPSFLSYVSPLVGTSLFWKSAEKGELRPNLRLRDLDGRSVCYTRCKSTDDHLTRFSENLFLAPRTLINRKNLAKSFARTCARLGLASPLSCYVNYRNSSRVFYYAKKRSRSIARTYIGGTDPLDAQYSSYPADICPQDRTRFFEPTMITDARGDLTEWLRTNPAGVSASAAASWSSDGATG